MSHHHHHHKPNNLRLAFFLNFGFTILEFIGGFWTNSVAIMSDALHDLGDSFSLGLAWYLERFSTKEQNARFSYGYRRFSLLGALINTIILIIGSLIILSEAIPRVFAPENPNVRGMILFAIVGILVNGWAAWQVSEETGLNSKVVSWHLFEDVLGWAVVLVGSLVMLAVDLPIIDPILSIGITLYVMWNVVKYLRQTVTIFLQAVPEGVDLAQLEAQFCSVNNVLSVHHTHLWSLDGDSNVLTTHIIVPSDAGRDEILTMKEQISACAKTASVAHITIEVEREGETCLMTSHVHSCNDHAH